ncbi:MAG TPA: VOC family protein [Candidatus Binataceae bacterium]|nr:VOC family protein [Candidatus Binataceae bacterium]
MADRVTSIRHVALEVPDFDSEREFIKKTWCLEEAEHDGKLSFFAAEGSPEAYIFRLRGGSERGIDLIALATDSSAAVDGLAAKLAKAGVRLISQPEALKTPGGGYGFRFFDPDGRAVEISSGVKERSARELKRGESIPKKLSHIVMHSPNLERTTDFYVTQLGFKVSDWFVNDNGQKCFSFLRCDSDHHSIAFVPGTGPALQHVAFEMRDVEEMMRGVGRLLKEKAMLQWGPGRHVLGNNTFAYFADPSGNLLEYTADIQQVDDSYQCKTLLMCPENADQWGTGVLGGSPMRGLNTNIPDPHAWKVPPL